MRDYIFQQVCSDASGSILEWGYVQNSNSVDAIRAQCQILVNRKSGLERGK